MSSKSFVLVLLGLNLVNADGCKPKVFDQESYVCVCNSNFCDEVQPVGDLKKGSAAIYTSSSDPKKVERLKRTNAKFQKFNADKTHEVLIQVDVNKTFQTVIGFGGAITDAVANVFHTGFDFRLQEMLIKQYYGNDSIEYNMGRVPIGSCDFSLNEWSYAEKDQDFELRSFSIEKDKKIALLQKILRQSPMLRLFGSPWSAPGWMKDTGRMKGAGRLLGGFNDKYYLTYAKYFVRFLNEYALRGIPFWGVTIQNEPSSGDDKSWSWQTMHFTPQEQRDFVHKRLGPMLRNNWSTKNIKIMAHDDQRSIIQEAADVIYDNKSTAGNVVDGLAVHWYSHSAYDPLTYVHNKRPDKFILASEACNAYGPEDHLPLLGSWQFAELYALDIINCLNNYVAGWVDWNIWLDEQGGPNWVGNFVDSPIIVNTTAQPDGTHIFYKQPMYYILGHFSKFIPADSVRISSKLNAKNSNLEATAMKTPNKKIVVVVVNTQNEAYDIVVKSAFDKHALNLNIGAKSIKTLIWQE